jgi:hypothetical protein
LQTAVGVEFCGCESDDIMRAGGVRERRGDQYVVRYTELVDYSHYLPI